jgi:ubiquinone/menaquinone biosynthesis C-methylase UbiE
MKHQDYVNLLRGAIASPGGAWADFGSGAGAFTLALAELIGPAGKIYSVDKDQGALREQARAMRAQFPDLTISYRTADFTHPLDLPLLEGIVMANALHFVAPPQKPEVVQLFRSYLRPGGRLILVEYNVDNGNYWVPYPLSYKTWESIAHQVGFGNTLLLSTSPSRFLKEFYSAVSW